MIKFPEQGLSYVYCIYGSALYSACNVYLWRLTYVCIIAYFQFYIFFVMLLALLLKGRDMDKSSLATHGVATVKAQRSYERTERLALRPPARGLRGNHPVEKIAHHNEE